MVELIKESPNITELDNPSTEVDINDEDIIETPYEDKDEDNPNSTVDVDSIYHSNNSNEESEEIEEEATNPSSIGHYKKSTIGSSKKVCPECGQEDCICNECDNIVEEEYNEEFSLSGTDQYAAERALDILRTNIDISISDAVSQACNEVSGGNEEPEYEDEEFYGEEADYDLVLNYVKSRISLS